MGHLQSALEPLTSDDPVRFAKVPVGTVVRYHGRTGSMRQGRIEFPAFVLKQHPDDGSLDLLVFFEAEDMIWEQRVLPWTEANPGHCWEVVEKPDRDLRLELGVLHRQMYGDYDPPAKSMIEYLDDFDKRLKKLEKSAR